MFGGNFMLLGLNEGKTPKKIIFVDWDGHRFYDQQPSSLKLP